MSEILLPKYWSYTVIGDVTTGSSQRKPDDVVEFTYVDIGSIDRERKTITSPQVLIGHKAPSRARKEIQTGDVLVSLTRPNLNAVAMVTKKYNGQIASTGFQVLRPLGVESKFLFAFVRTTEFIDGISGRVQGALYPAANSKDVCQMKLPFPPLPEQKEITKWLDGLLGQVESLKSRLDAIPTILKRFRQSTLAAAVSGRLTEEWRGISDLASTWAFSSVGDIGVVATGKTPKRTEPRYWLGGNIPWVTSSETGKPFCIESKQFVTSYAQTECGLKLFSPGTLLMAMYGEGKTRGQVTELKISAACNQACAAIIVNEENVVRNFVKLVLVSNYEETRKAAEGGAQPNLNLQKVRDIPIPLPPLPEQKEIVRRVEELFAFADQIEAKIAEAKARVEKLTPSILAKAFRGELTADWREAHPELIGGEHAAGALLDRIKAERAKREPKKKTRKKAKG